MPIRLLIVDDSAFMRKIITDIVAEFDGVEVIGIARNGLDALDIIPTVMPDIITLDVEMPRLNGIETLKRIKAKYDIPVIMLSSHTGTDITIEALQVGAVDFIEKPTDLRANLSELKTELEMKIKSVLKKKKTDSLPVQRFNIPDVKITKEIKAVVIGASTGGPKALVHLISKLPRKMNIPIFIVQHMPKGFTTSFANRLDSESNAKVVEAKDGMIIQNGTVYLAPGDFHMIIDRNTIRLSTNEKIHGVRPAVDHLFKTASEVYKSKLLAIIMTGMGKDGSEGMKVIKNNGGYNLAQNEASCVVYGMPGSAVAKGVVDEILSLEGLSTNLNRVIGDSAQ
ncbi:chemotaxis-specific protein-glutamate methyltransferase CheB [Alkalibaculum sp. M08DMB]|uniref:Protein-glutamate methylesterase/protein-glutamine glutaminase n=1 Tax=Alkalibaculum sporogenes TaxID=2655001 RepID=A0A6A7K6B4_9FIRM|nr:chemotaxis response regulator protein-glutamate methylesterase [Alkalibaculum sporogenes]MPW24757.1 chemotaxis-specific protein-glutamate methyltransferase CheB [Alkalibaculum sporogenes]